MVLVWAAGQGRGSVARLHPGGPAEAWQVIVEEDPAGAIVAEDVHLRLEAGGVVEVGQGDMGQPGELLAVEQQNVTPDAYLPKITFILYVIVILGGAGTILGPILGAITFQFMFFTIDALMVNAQANIGWVGDLLTPAAAGQIKLVLVGIGMMVLMIFRPQGILGNREEVLIDEH